jgi:hypothetical protein
MKLFWTCVLVTISAVAVIGYVLLSQPISRAKDTPLMRALSRIHGISAKLKWYADEHSSFPGGATTNASIEALSTVGILSTDDVAYLRDHGVKYYGSDLSHIAPDIPVFEMVFTNATRSYHIISYRDGHTEVPDLHNKP